MDIGLPACALEVRAGNERIATIVPLAGKDETIASTRKELSHRLCDPAARLIHQVLRRNATRECCIFCVAHLHRGNNRRVHCASELTSFFSVLELFF